METPTPTWPPAMDTEAAAIRAEISEVLAALRATLPALVTSLFSMKARVSVNTTLSAMAPAPLMGTRTPAPKAIAAEAATV